MPEILQIILSGLIPVVASVLLFFIFNKTKWKNWNFWVKQVIIGLIFGGLCCLSTELSVSFDGAVINIRTACVCSSSFIFGWPSGLIAAAIGAFERGLSVLWVPSRAYTELACILGTATAGVASALLKRFIFDKDKVTSPFSGAMAAFVIEVFHVTLVFITNTNDVATAFKFVEGITFKLVLTNTISVFVTLLTVFLVYDRKGLVKKKRTLANSIQHYLFLTVTLLTVVTILFTQQIENSVALNQAQATIVTDIEDVKKEIKKNSDTKMKNVSESCADEVDISGIQGLNDLDVSKPYDTSSAVHNLVTYLATRYSVTEVNLVNSNGYIYASTHVDYYAFYMNDPAYPSCCEFSILLTSVGPRSYVQEFKKQEFGEGEYFKYAGTKLACGGYIQIGYNSTRFYEEVESSIYGVTEFRRVGTEGRMLIADGNELILSDYNNALTRHYLYHDDVLGFDIQLKPMCTLQKAAVAGTDSYYYYDIFEGYFVIGTMTVSEVNFNRDMTIYLIAFMEIIAYGILFVLIYVVVDKLIVNKINKVNDGLAKITDGDLNVVIDEHQNYEFQCLSTDINKTVDTLKQYIDEANARIDRELMFARTIQLSSLPAPVPMALGLDVYAMMFTAKEVGGDFYDYFPIDKTHYAILVADVSGKGIPAALFMMKSKTLLKSLADKGKPVETVFTEANKQLCEENEAEMFVTAWMGIIDLETGHVEYCNAGHCHPLIYSYKNNEFSYHKSKPNFVLGGLDSAVYHKGELTLEQGDMIFLYTDGVTEATNRNDEILGEDRLLQICNDVKGHSNRSFLSRIKARVDEFVDGREQFDDITMLDFSFLKDKPIKTITLKADLEGIENGIEFVKENIQDVASPDSIKKMCVTLDEILNNICSYAYGDNKNGKMRIVIRKTPGDFKVIISDEGIPYNPLEKEDPNVDAALEDRQIGGLGIFLVKKLNDDIHYFRFENHNILAITNKNTK